MRVIYCCEMFKSLILSEDIGTDCGVVEIHGAPDYANDGDGYIDDMTGTYQILFCPFCGVKIVEDA